MPQVSLGWVGCGNRCQLPPPLACPCPVRACAHAPAELASLRQHRDWADRRIAQLIKRVSDAERPVREEAARLMREVQALRVGSRCEAWRPAIRTTACMTGACMLHSSPAVRICLSALPRRLHYPPPSDAA